MTASIVNYRNPYSSPDKPSSFSTVKSIYLLNHSWNHRNKYSSWEYEGRVKNFWSDNEKHFFGLLSFYFATWSPWRLYIFHDGIFSNTIFIVWNILKKRIYISLLSSNYLLRAIFWDKETNNSCWGSVWISARCHGKATVFSSSDTVVF